MTNNQKEIAKILIHGGTIVNNGRYGVRLRDSEANPIRKVTQPTFYNLAHRWIIIKKNKKTGLWEVSPKGILSLHKKNFIKRYYKGLKINKGKAEANL